MKLREIERLRGVAILLVLFVHADYLYPFTPKLLHGSWSGVDLFFVISGFVVTLSLTPQLGEGSTGTTLEALGAARGTLKAFYTRRVYRLLPMAMFVFALQLVLVWSVRGTTNVFGSFHGVLVEIALILTGVYNYAVANVHEPRLSIFWSLCVEEHFYLLVPVLFILARTRRRRLAVCVAVILLIALVVRPLSNELDNYVIGRLRSHLRFDSLMAGVCLALVHPRDKTVPPQPLVLPRALHRYVVVPALIALIATFPMMLPEPVVHRWGFSVLWFVSAVVVATGARDQDLVLGFPVVGRALEWVGARSYSMYLVHWSLFGVVTELANRTGWEPTHPARAAGLFVVCVGVTCVVSDLAHRYIERPFIAAGRARVESWRRKEPLGKSPVGLPTLAAVLGILGAAAAVWAIALAPRTSRPLVWAGEYYAGPDLRGPPTLRQDPAIDFFWGEHSPVLGVPSQFSARWKSCLRLERETRLELVLGSDDGSRLRVDGNVAIENWRDQGMTFVSGIMTLQPGVHSLEVDYYNRGGGASATLRAGFDGGHPTDFPEGSLHLPNGVLGCATMNP